MGYIEGGLSQSGTSNVAQSENTENQQHVFIWTDAHRRAANQLEFAINSPTNVVMMLGKSGVGKSRLIEEVVEFVLIDQAVAYLTDPGCLDEDLVGIVREAVLGLADSYAHETIPVFIVDDADKLHHDTLSKLVRMSHPDDGGDPVFKLVLVARPGFDDTMQTIVPGLTGPAFQIWPLDEKEAGSFVDEWLKVRGLGDILTDEEQREKMLERADGLPGALIGAIEWHAKKAGKPSATAEAPAQPSAEPSVEPSVEPTAPDFSALRKASMAKAPDAPAVAEKTEEPRDEVMPAPEAAKPARPAPEMAAKVEQSAPSDETPEVKPAPAAPKIEQPAPAEAAVAQKPAARIEMPEPQSVPEAPKAESPAPDTPAKADEPAPRVEAKPVPAAPKAERPAPAVAARPVQPVQPKATPDPAPAVAASPTRPQTLKEMANAQPPHQPEEQAKELVGLTRLERAMLLKGKGSTRPIVRPHAPQPEPQTLESKESRERLERMARAALSLTPEAMDPQDHPDLDMEPVPETTRRRLSGGDIVLGLVAASMGVLTSFAIDRYPIADWSLPPALAAKVDAFESVTLPRVQSFVADLTKDG